MSPLQWHSILEMIVGATEHLGRFSVEAMDSQAFYEIMVGFGELTISYI